MREPIMRAGGKAVLAGLALWQAGAAWAADPEMAHCLLARKASARLDCFEALARQRNADAPAFAAVGPTSTAPAPSPGAIAQMPPPAAETRRRDFGLSAAQREERRPAKDQQLKQVRVVVAAIRPFGAGLWSILTEDGATWRVTEARQAFRPPKAGDTIELERGALGSYLLVFDHQPAIRAKRLD